MSFLKTYWPWLFGGVATVAAAATFLKGGTKVPTIGQPIIPISGTLSTVPPMTATNLTSYLSDAFFRKVLEFAHYSQQKGAKVNGEDYLRIFMVESSCDPRIANSIGCAGLNQICNLKGVGFTGSRQEYTALPGEQQMEYVKRYFDNVNRYPAMVDVGSLYLANFSPAFLGKPQNFVMYRKDVDKAYAANAGVDSGKKGFIEVADMAKFVHRGDSSPKLRELLGRMAAVNQLGSV
jgi:hypothetical protein